MKKRFADLFYICLAVYMLGSGISVRVQLDSEISGSTEAAVMFGQHRAQTWSAGTIFSPLTGTDRSTSSVERIIHNLILQQ